MMGCDIHLCLEERRADGTWKPIPPTGRFKCAFVPDSLRWECDRNYAVFTQLAGVRNYHHLFGRSGIKVFAEPRGLPGDISDEVKRELGRDWLHSHSYFTVDELDKFNSWAPETACFYDLYVSPYTDRGDRVRLVFAFDD